MYIGQLAYTYMGLVYSYVRQQIVNQQQYSAHVHENCVIEGQSACMHHKYVHAVVGPIAKVGWHSNKNSTSVSTV
jgi:hypothetical protein